MITTLAIVAYLIVGFVAASVYERHRRQQHCLDSYHCRMEHPLHWPGTPWFVIFLWPVASLLAGCAVIVSLVYKYLNPAKGADAIDAVGIKIVEAKKAAEKKKMHTLVEGKGEND